MKMFLDESSHFGLRGLTPRKTSEIGEKNKKRVGSGKKKREILAPSLTSPTRTAPTDTAPGLPPLFALPTTVRSPFFRPPHPSAPLRFQTPFFTSLGPLPISGPHHSRPHPAHPDHPHPDRPRLHLDPCSFVPCVTFYSVPKLFFFVPFLFFMSQVHFLFCPDDRLLILSRFRFFVPLFFFCPSTGQVVLAKGISAVEHKVYSRVQMGMLRWFKRCLHD